VRKPSESEWSALVSHPSAPGEGAFGVEARVQIAAPGLIGLQYVLRGEIARLRIPPPRSVERADELWKHTCFEAFLRAADAAGYCELNVAPSRQWALYRFDAYRTAMSSANPSQAPEISVRRFEDRLEIDATVDLHEALDLHAALDSRGPRRLQIGLAAVIEDANGTLSYWALKHAEGKPDFHGADGFVLELAV
jgi:hypothetical protein